MFKMQSLDLFNVNQEEEREREKNKKTNKQTT